MTLISVFAVLASLIGPVEEIDPTKGKQNVLEYAYDFCRRSFTKGNIGEHYIRTIPCSCLFFSSFFLVANNIGWWLKSKRPIVYNLWTSPTANLELWLCLFILVACPYVEGIRRRGVKEYLKTCDTQFMTPWIFWKEFTNFASLALQDLRKYLCELSTSKLACDFVASSCLLVSSCAIEHGVDSVFDFHFMYQTMCCHVVVIYIGKEINGEKSK